MDTDNSRYYDGRRRSKIVLSSDFECCHKYKPTLPEHVELVGGSDSYEKLRTASMKSKNTLSEESSRTQSIGSSKSEVGSEKSKERLDTLEMADELVEDTYSEVEVEMGEEEEEYESSICSEWIVLKPEKKRRKKKEIVEESSVSDLNEPAGTRRLLKRPPSPEGEMFDEESRPKNLIPSNFFRYEDLEEWPEPPPMEKALLKREPSPNMSLPRSRDNLELGGEDWLWFEGHYMEGGDLEIHGEGEVHYRLPTQWKEGHWEPAPALLERWEREELEQEKERQGMLEERRKYEEIIKREDSPGMDVMNWGDGPVKLTAWMKYVGPKSLKELSDLLPTSISEQLDRIASEVPPEILKELMARVDEAMTADNSLQMIQQLLDAYISKGLDVVEDRTKKEDALVQDSNMMDSTKPAMNLQEHLKAMSSKSVRFVEEPQEAAAEELLEEVDECMAEEQSVEEVEEEQAPIIPRPKIIRDDPCDPLPESFRETLLGFIQDFVADKPGDPLTYAIGYFQSRIPRTEDDIEKSLPGEVDSHSQVAPDRRLAALHASSKQSDKENSEEGEIEEYPKTPKEIEILVRALNSCWVTKDLDLATVIALVKAMNQIDMVENDVIQSADVEPDTFYVIKKGAFKIQNDYGTKILRDRGFFGELSLNAMVSESLKAPYSATSLKRGSLWCLKRSDFLKIKDTFEKNKNTILFSMMGVMDLFDNLTEEEKRTVVDCLDMRYFKRKDIIFCQDSDPEGIYFFLDGVFKLIKIDQGRGSAGSSVRTSYDDNSQKKRKKTYTASTYPSPRVLGYGNFVDSRPWGYSCVARSNIVQVAILKTDVFERLLGDPEDVLTRPPPPPPRPRPIRKMFFDSEGEAYAYGELRGEYYGEYDGEAMEEAAPPPPPPPKVIPWLKKKVAVDPDEPPKPKPPPTYEEIMDAMWGTKPVYQHPKDSACLCGQCKNTVTCVGQGMKCCDKPKVNIETKK